MPKINVLPEDLINKIAAGEVIERPASVVKELVENSLDAGATRLLIEIEDYGQRLIKVQDNGEGMDEQDARNSLLRHATSKIKDAQDLFEIQTLGFRGEALASIAAVSRLTLRTKQKQALEGFELVVEGGRIIKSGVAAAETGTTIEVQDLFFNTPARKKFMKSDAIEFKHIIEVIEHYALIYPQAAFKLLHDHREVLQSPAVSDWRENIATIYGVNVAKSMLEISGEGTGIKVSGFVSKPYDARNDKTQQALFVNKRWIRNEELTRSIYEGYHSLLFVNKHPIFIINIDVDPHQIDVNVHPTKSDIKIEQKSEVQKVLFDAVREALRKNDLLPVMDFNAENQLNSYNKTVKPTKYAFDPSEQTVLQVKESEAAEYGTDLTTSTEPFPEPVTTNAAIIQNTHDYILPQSEKIPPLRLLGQVHKTFFVAETPGGVLFIDQHVVQERVLYEKFMEQYLNQDVAVQNLLKPEVLELTATQRMLVLENQDRLRQMGFILEEFGERSFVLKTVPAIFGRMQPKELIFEIIALSMEGKNKFEQIQEDIITRMACRASVKAGDNVTLPEMQHLLSQLGQTKFPYTCPHGRAVLIKFDVDELERKFRRK